MRWSALKRGSMVTAVISGLGLIFGALTAIALTYLGNRIAGAAHPPSVVVYRWNVTVFAIMGAVFSPVLAWSMLRNVPLWRTVAEPALVGLASTVLCFVTAPMLFPVVVPGAIVLSAFRLSRAYERAATHASAPIEIPG